MAAPSGPNSSWQSRYGSPDSADSDVDRPVDSDRPQPTLAETHFGAFNIGQSLSYGWRAFRATWVPWVLSVLVFLAVLFFLVAGVITVAFSGYDPEASSEFSAWVLLVLLAFAIATVYLFIWVLNCYRNALRVVRGQTITFTDFFRFRGLGSAFVVYLLVTLILVAGSALFYLPGIIAGIILLFAVPATFHIRDCSVGDAFAITWRVVTGNIFRVVLLFLLAGVLNFLGGVVIVGVIITTPLMYLIYAHALQTAIGGPISQRI